MPGGDGLIITIAGAWAGLLIFYRVFSRPPGNGYPVGIEWGFFLAFIAAGALAYAGWRIRAAERPPAPAPPAPRRDAPRAAAAAEAAPTPRRSAPPVAARPRSAATRTPASCRSRIRPPRPRYPPARRAALGPRRRPARAHIILRMTPSEPQSVEQLAEGLRAVGYLPGESTALVSYLATRLGKPVLVEGPAGVGKTELAKALSRMLGRELVRLQCYEGLDEAKALYEWNYRKQLLRIQAEADDAGWEAVQEDIFGEEFLLARPLMRAIASEEPVVLLIDEIDKTDQEFEAMLLEVLSDFQISIPELGRVECAHPPDRAADLNNSRELTEALKRRCLYLWLDYPELEHELEIVLLHAPELSRDLARRLVEVIGMVRELDLKKPPSIAESIDWARALLLLGVEDIDGEVFSETMSVIVKHRTDMDSSPSGSA